MKEQRLFRFDRVLERQLARLTRLLAFLPAMLLPSPVAAGSGAPSRWDDVVVLVCAVDSTHLAGDVLVRPAVFRQAKFDADLNLSPAEKQQLEEVDEQIEANFVRPHASKQVWKGDHVFMRRGLDDLRRRVAETLRPPHLSRVKGLIIREYGLWAMPLADMRRLFPLGQDQVSAMSGIRERMFSKINSTLDNPARARSEAPCRFTSARSAPVKRILDESEKATVAAMSSDQVDFIDRLKAGLVP